MNARLFVAVLAFLIPAAAAAQSVSDGYDAAAQDAARAKQDRKAKIQAGVADCLDAGGKAEASGSDVECSCGSLPLSAQQLAAKTSCADAVAQDQRERKMTGLELAQNGVSPYPAVVALLAESNCDIDEPESVSNAALAKLSAPYEAFSDEAMGRVYPKLAMLAVQLREELDAPSGKKPLFDQLRADVRQASHGKVELVAFTQDELDKLEAIRGMQPAHFWHIYGGSEKRLVVWEPDPMLSKFRCSGPSAASAAGATP